MDLFVSALLSLALIAYLIQEIIKYYNQRGKEIYAEILANGRPSPAKLRNAMSNPKTWNTLKSLGFIPDESKMLGYNDKKNELLFLDKF